MELQVSKSQGGGGGGGVSRESSAAPVNMIKEDFLKLQMFMSWGVFTCGPNACTEGVPFIMAAPLSAVASQLLWDDQFPLSGC